MCNISATGIMGKFLISLMNFIFRFDCCLYHLCHYLFYHEEYTQAVLRLKK